MIDDQIPNEHPVGPDGSAAPIQLTPEDQLRFAQALITPPPPTPALERADAARRELIEPG